MPRIESLLSARLFLVPQLVGERLFFISNLAGHLSLYSMRYGGSVPEPLLPPHLAMQNPHLMDGVPYHVFPRLGKILVILDNDGDENYQPMWVPVEGGFPEPAFGEAFVNERVHLRLCDDERNVVYFSVESRMEPLRRTYQANLENGELIKLATSAHGAYPQAHNQAHTKVILLDKYSTGDSVLYLWSNNAPDLETLFGIPLEQRAAGQQVLPNGILEAQFTPSETGLLLRTTLYDDRFGLAYLNLEERLAARPVKTSGAVHSGNGEMRPFHHLKKNRYLIEYNIDGYTWLYEGIFDENACTIQLDSVIAGQGLLSNGVLEAFHYDEVGDRFTLTFSTAISPTQIHTVGVKPSQAVVTHTSERLLGIPHDWLSAGEDASYSSFDGMPISAKLYLPADPLGFSGPRPLVYYIHGGPQSQERPDFAWFSMPLIQFLTLKGFAVFVPNVRGSTGYGLEFTRQVLRDWGGKDRQDHVFAMQEFLPKHPRLDVSRAGVVGRSYGGYMTLTLASRHPQLWSAAVDMFGPYDLLTFMERIPESWKPIFNILLGDPQLDRELLVDRSPRTYIEKITSPLLVIQGKNDPRVVAQESRDLVQYLRAKGRQVEFLLFDNEGHDVLKYENRVACYNAITEFFIRHLRPDDKS